MRPSFQVLEAEERADPQLRGVAEFTLGDYLEIEVHYPYAGASESVSIALADLPKLIEGLQALEKISKEVT